MGGGADASIQEPSIFYLKFGVFCVKMVVSECDYLCGAEFLSLSDI